MLAVLTTIRPPTAAVASLAGLVARYGGSLVVVGDRKSPGIYDLEGTEFYPIDDQHALPFRTAKQCPENHYARKNVGYLVAIRAGTGCIYETDDDNAPMRTWAPRRKSVAVHKVAHRGWVNVYRYFSDRRIWPRGFPLDAIAGSFDHDGEACERIEVSAPIQQGLVNGSPDVDAIWRLTSDREMCFQDRPSIYLPPGSWAPFNSQSTWWHSLAYPLLYLPSHCSFRMTDIWRAFVAQRCLWELETGVVFHAAEVVQERNPHDLMQDFEAELPGYRHNRDIADLLEGLPLKPGRDAIQGNLHACYEALVGHGYLPNPEIKLVEAWLDDLSSVDLADTEE